MTQMKSIHGKYDTKLHLTKELDTFRTGSGNTFHNITTARHKMAGQQCGSEGDPERSDTTPILGGQPLCRQSITIHGRTIKFTQKRKSAKVSDIGENPHQHHPPVVI
jgi:hypothetical protein